MEHKRTSLNFLEVESGSCMSCVNWTLLGHGQGSPHLTWATQVLRIVSGKHPAFFSKDNREKPAVEKSDQFKELKLYKITFTGKCSRTIISIYLFDIPFHVCRDNINYFLHEIKLRWEIRLLSNRTPSFLFRIAASQKEIPHPAFSTPDVAFSYLRKFPWQFHYWVTGIW